MFGSRRYGGDGGRGTSFNTKGFRLWVLKASEGLIVALDLRQSRAGLGRLRPAWWSKKDWENKHPLIGRGVCFPVISDAYRQSPVRVSPTLSTIWHHIAAITASSRLA